MEEKTYAKAMGQLHTNEIGDLRTQFHKKLCNSQLKIFITTTESCYIRSFAHSDLEPKEYNDLENIIIPSIVKNE